MKSAWLEAAINGPWSRSRQPLMPIIVDNCIAHCIACARWVAIIHVHAYDQVGKQKDDPDTYARIIEGIRAVEDVIVYPTLPRGDGAPPISIPRATSAKGYPRRATSE